MSSQFEKRLSADQDPFTGLAQGGMAGLQTLLVQAGVQDESPSEDAEKDRVLTEFRQLLGPLVDGNLRGDSRALSLEVLGAKEFSNFNEFKSFLAQHAGLNDGCSFRDSYKSLLEGQEFESLLRYLYRELDPKQYSALNSGEASLLLEEFKAALITISGEAFARNFSSSPSGRSMLQQLLAKDSILDRDQRADLIQGIYHSGDDKNVKSMADWENILDARSPFHASKMAGLGYVNLWVKNYFNLWTDEELAEGRDGALAMLESIDHFSEKAETKSLSGAGPLPEDAYLLVEGERQAIPTEDIEHYRALALENFTETGAIAQAKWNLAKLWLFAADADNFTELGYRVMGRNLNEAETSELRRQLMAGSEKLIRQAEGMASRQDFETFHEELEEFLTGPIYGAGNEKPIAQLKSWAEDPSLENYLSQALPKLKALAEHHAMGASVGDYLSEMPTDLRAPLDRLIHQADLWKYSKLEMDEGIRLRPIEIKANNPELKARIAVMINGLEQTKDSLWYGYKQHKALSRLDSQLADSLLNNGDIKEIEAAQITIDSLIYQLSEVESPEDVAAIHKELVEALEPEGTLFKALEAAEMDGYEQVVGLGQTIVVMVVLAMMTRGASLALQGIRAAAGAGEVLEMAEAAVQAAEYLSASERAFLLGAALTTAENSLAVATGEVRRGPELVHVWLKEAVATGAAMAVTAGMMPRLADLPLAQQNLIQQLWARYTTGGVKGLGHLAADTGLELFEETLDQFLAQGLQGEFGSIQKDEFHEIALICIAGGGAKVGVMAQSIKQVRVEATQAKVQRSLLPSDSSDDAEVGAGIHEVPPLSNAEPANDNAPKLAPSFHKPNLWPQAMVAAAAGMGVYFNSDLGHEVVAAGRTLLQITSSLGNAILSQEIDFGSWGILSAGILAMAVKGGAGNDPSKNLNKTERKKLNKIYRDSPELKVALDTSSWTEREKLELLTQMTRGDNTKEQRLESYKSLISCLEALGKTDWSSQQKYEFLLNITLKAGEKVQLAFKFLSFSVFHRFPLSTWSSDQSYQSLNQLLEITGEEFWEICNGLHPILETLGETPWSFEQQSQLLYLLTKKCNKNSFQVFAYLGAALEGLKLSPWTWEQKFQFLFRFVQKSGDQGPHLLPELKRIIPHLQEVAWSDEEQRQFLFDLAENTKVDHAQTSMMLQGVFRAFNESSWSKAQKHELLTLVLKTPGPRALDTFRQIPPLLKALADIDWNVDSQTELLTQLIKNARLGVAQVLQALPKLIQTLSKASWSSGQVFQFLYRISEKADAMVGYSFDFIPPVLAAFQKVGWNPQQSFDTLNSIFENNFEDMGVVLDFIPKLAKYSGSTFQSSIQDYLKLLTLVNVHNRDSTLHFINRNDAIFDKMGSGSFSKNFAFLVRLFERWPRLGYSIMEGVIDAIHKKVLPKDLSGHQAKITNFIEATHGFIPSLYQEWLRKGDGLFLNLEEYKKEIFNDALGMPEIEKIVQDHNEEFLLGLLQTTSPTSGASSVPKKQQLGFLKLALKSGDLRHHIPQEWRGKSELFFLSQGSWELKSGHGLDETSGLQKLLMNLREPLGEVKIQQSNLIAALEEYLQPGNKASKALRVRKILYALAKQDRVFSEKIKAIPTQGYTTLVLLEQLFEDQDNFPKILAKALEAVDPSYFKGQGRRRPIPGNPKRLVQSLQRVWSKQVGGKDLSQDKRLEILGSILKAYEPQAIEAKILSRPELSSELKAGIRLVMEHAPDLSKKQLIGEILLKPIQLIQREKAKFEYRERQDLPMALRPVKGPAFSLHGLTTGVCTFDDLKLWENPKFKLLAMINEQDSQAVGYIQVFETEIAGKKYLNLVGINPSAEFMGMVKTPELYQGLMDSVIGLAKVGGYESVFIPTDENIYSNRRDIRKAVEASAYPIKSIPEVRWNHKPEPYPFSEVFVAWKRGE